MPSFKKSIAWFAFIVLCGLSVIPLFIWSITFPFIPGAPMLFGALGLGVFVGFKIYGAYAELKVEYYKRSGFARVTQKNRLKNLKDNRKVWRDKLAKARTSHERDYALRGLVSAESDMANELGVPYDEPEMMRGRV